MRKVFLMAAAAMLILFFTLCGCSAGVTQKAMPKEMQVFSKSSDSQLIGKLENYVLFSNSKNLRNYNLLDLYLDIVNNSEYPKNYIDKWYNKQDKKYHIPVDEIKQVLVKYLDYVNFTPSDFDTSSENGINEYDAKANQIVIYINPSNEKRTCKVLQKEQLSDDTMKITILYDVTAYGDEDEYKIAFILKFSDNGFKYLSIVKN
jgi:hypothetical protein